MKYCNDCGKEVNEGQDVCLSCGTNMGQTSNVVDTGGFGWGVLGFCIPIVGLILFLVWHSEKPKTAKAVGIGALIGVGVAVIYYAIMIAFFSSTFLPHM